MSNMLFRELKLHLGTMPRPEAIIRRPRVFYNPAPPNPAILFFGCLYAQFDRVQEKPNLH